MDPDAPIDLPATISQDPGTDLLSTYWPAAGALLLGALGVVLVVRTARRRDRTRRGGTRRGMTRRRRALLATAWSVPTAVLLVVSLALGVNTWVGYFPSASALSRWLDDKLRDPVTTSPKTAIGKDAAIGTDPAARPGERVTSSDRGHAYLAGLPSTSAGVTDRGAWVYLPPDYDAPGNTARYPVIYTLHGAPGSAADWFAGGRIDYYLDVLITQKRIPPVILVSPDLNSGAERLDGEPLDLPGGPQLETFVTKDVVSWADARLRTIPDAQHRVVAGMSAGGLGSLLYALHSPAVFGGAISIMPYNVPYTKEIVADEAARRRNTPLDVIAARGAASGQRIFLGQGDGEPAAESTQIRDALRAQGDVTTLRVLPGLGHTWTTARTVMPYGLVWVAQQLGWQTP
ncbi:enterochelin esterase-like enzyme [Microbacterium resistens]|uniref:Enterochelin esterase-like enzyme n=1 Tax=Microbacterium resistens TaxID=156977 RepID=A0ABU1SBS7_9MICO|nr:alpha/beta hydrolase-fold protein [Microbacterium resistens]MDR6867065.1 enterochelin esterase-like enzyme [Microbacterium resistens]